MVTGLPLFDGVTFNAKRDTSRLHAQLDSVRSLMFDGRWRTLSEIAEHVDAPEASVSARLRDLRKLKFGGYRVERQYVAQGLFQYRINFTRSAT